MEKKVDLSMFLDFNSSIIFLKKFKEKLDIFNDDNWNIDIYNKNTYEKRLQSMPFFYLDSHDEYDSDIKLEYNLLKNIPWHYDFDIYEKVLHELNIVKENDIWDNYKHTKKYISNDNDTKTKNYYPNINEIKKYIPRGYLIPPIDKENIELKIDKTINKNSIQIQQNNDITNTPIIENDYDNTEKPTSVDTNIVKLYYKIIDNNDKLTKEKFTNFMNKNKTFFDKLVNSNIIISSYDDIVKYYFNNNDFIELSDFKDKTKTIINYKKKYEIYLDDLINTENIQENFTNFFESSVNPINDETNSPKSYTNIFNFKNKLWEKKIINISLWVFLYILIILFIFAIVISFIK
tara:strand:+ start:73410 stop:74453 length:1044 start_codon:yes stop_codon:yes gene_type:complete